jgi:hypothetical protein
MTGIFYFQPLPTPFLMHNFKLMSVTINSTYEKSNWKVLPLVFSLVLGMLILLGGMASWIAVDRFLPTFNLFNQMVFVSLGVSIGVSAGNKLRSLTIRPENHAQIMKKVTESLHDIGFKPASENPQASDRSFRNTRRIHRLFSDWLGTERIKVVKKEEIISITGPSRYLTELVWKLESSGQVMEDITENIKESH